MKGDFTRDTFDPTKHYQQVLMQQGRAQLDADWNEQAALGERRDETTTADIVGKCGGPAERAAFGVTTDGSLTAGDFFLSAGHYYVDGILCENESAIAYTAQPDRVNVEALATDNSYLLYLDVWQRLLTALEDGEIREPALGGPDTATRVKTIWQVRALECAKDSDNPCGSGADDFAKLFDLGTAMLTAGTVAEQAPDDPCIVPPSGGYTGLENQLYRVEIHDPGAAIDDASDNNSVEVSLPGAALPQNQIIVAAGAATGDTLEIYPSKIGSPDMKGQVVWVTGVSDEPGLGAAVPLYRLLNSTNGDHFYTTPATERDSAIANFGYTDEGVAGYIYESAVTGTTAFYRLLSSVSGDHFYTTSATERDSAIANFGYTDEGIAGYLPKAILTLNVPVTGFVDEDEPRLRHADATWKWSRENGSVTTRIEKIDVDKITVSSLGPDKNLGFVQGAWVEILDDALELEGKAGELAQIDEVDETTGLVTLKSSVSSLVPADAVKFPPASYPDGIVPERHPKLRRWEGVAAVKYIAPEDGDTNWLPLESGVQVRFASAGDYRTGHYWQIPARTATAGSPNGEIEWPLDDSGDAIPVPPKGITHHFCRLGIVTVDSNGVASTTDCRCLWPALTAVPRLFYVSGDGQEVMPDLTAAKTYVLDDGTAENTIGGGIDGDIICLNQFTVIPGSETINSISIAWGASVKPDPSLNGLPYTVVVWSDPDGDGDPTDAKVLTTASGVIVQQGPDTFITTAITPTTITTPTFFVGFVIHHSVDQFPAAIDESAPISKRSFVAGGTSGDISDLTNNELPVAPIESYGLVGNWLIRADAGGGFSRVKLPHPLIVGVPKAYRRDTVQKVRFTVEGPSAGLVVAVGNVPSQNFAEIGLDSEGLAKCDFYLDRINATQQVRAVLIDDSGCSKSLPVLFNANLSIASQVAYDPGACAGLQGQRTVQDAMRRLASLAHIEIVGGDGQDTDPDQPLLNALSVLVSNKCGPVQYATVTFTAADGFVAKDSAGITTSTDSTIDVTTDPNGIAECYWRPALAPASQQLFAEITLLPAGLEPEAHQSVFFTANVRPTGHGSSCCLTVGADGDFKTLKEAVATLIPEFVSDQEKVLDICLCLMPGDHEISEELKIRAPAIVPSPSPQYLPTTVKIGGCGYGSRLSLKASLSAAHLESFTLSDLAVLAAEDILNPIIIDSCGDVSITGCSLYQVWTTGTDLLRISNARRVVITNNFMLSQAKSPLTHLVVRFGPALVIVDAKLETAILNNMIFGDVRFYGTQGAFTQEDFDTKVAQPVVDGTLVIDLQADGGDARIEGNSLTRLTVDQDILSNLSTDTPPKLLGLFRRMSLLNNTIQPRSLNLQGFVDPYPCVQWLGAHVISNGNYFILPAQISELIPSVGSAAAASFICVGTSSSNLPAGRDYLYYAIPNVDAFRESANLIALIPFNPTPSPRPILPPPRPPPIPRSVSPKRKRKAPRPKPG